MNTISDNDKSLEENIAKLTELVEKLSSIKFTFFRGIVNGVGTFIGATIVATIVITAVIQIFGYFGIGDYLEPFIPKK